MTTEQQLQEALDDTWLYGWPKGFNADYTYNRPTFETYIGEETKCTWLVPAVTVRPNRGDHIYRSAFPDITRYGGGFAGRTLYMPLINGETFELRGGWAVSSRFLLEDTGIDCTNMHLTYGAVGLHKLDHGHMPGLFGLLHADKAPQIGNFYRIEHLAQHLANERNERVFYSVVSYGGGSAGQKDPERR